MAAFDGRRLLTAAALVGCAIAACAPPIPLERLRCPCLGAEGYQCCEQEQICYRAEDMPASCASVGAAVTADGGADLGMEGADAPDAADAADAADPADAAGETDSPDGADAPGTSDTADGGDAIDRIDAAHAADAIDGDGGRGGGGGGRGGGSGGGGSGGGGSGGGGSGGYRSVVDGYFLPPPAILATGQWLYTTDAPAGGWMLPVFDTTGWWKGQPGFLGGADPSFGDNPQTPWPEGEPELWLRTTFRIDDAEIPRALLWGRWDDTIEVYVNGALAAPIEPYTPGYRYLGLKTATLVSGAPNTLAVHVTDQGGARYFDLAVALNGALTMSPMSGFERTPTLAVYTNAVRQFMREHGIPGGALAVMKKDQVVVNRGFGWADKSFTRPMPPDVVMRLPGQDVIPTAGAVVTLIDAGIADPITREKITRDTRVFPLFRAHGLRPLPGRTPVPEIDQVTVGMLLAFESGVSELSGDPGQIYPDLGVAPGSPTTAEDNVRWVYSMPLARPLGSPGDRYTGYMLLRHLVHIVTGDLLAFLRTAVFAPAGTSDVFIAHEPLAARDAREPGYLTLEPPYDRSIYLENCTVLATTAEAFVRYLRRYHAYWGTPLIDPVTRQWAAVPDNGTHVLFGAAPGTWSVVEQRRHDEVNIAVFFNLAGDYGALFEQLESITNSLPESAWGL